MDNLEFTAKVVEAVVWPFALTIAASVIYLNRGRGGAFFGELFKRIKELSVGNFKVVLAESSAPPTLTTDVKETHYRRYTNGVLVQELKFILSGGMKLDVTLPIAFPNELLSVQFTGCAPLPIDNVTRAGFSLDARGFKGQVRFELKVAGL